MSKSTSHGMPEDPASTDPGISQRLILFIHGRIHRNMWAEAPTAMFLGTDTTTQGDWTTAYGREGYVLPGIASATPSYATITPSGHSSWTF